LRERSTVAARRSAHSNTLLPLVAASIIFCRA
jgi:hypothetical protein